MSDATKKTHARSIPKTSQAPDPPTPIRGSYGSPKNTPADYDKWNLFPTVSESQFTYLQIGCNPGSSLYGEKKSECADLVELIRSHQANDTFPNPVDPWRHNPKYRAVEIIEWAKDVGKEPPKAWKPIKPKVKQTEKRINKPERQRTEAMRAAKLMVRQGKPPGSMQDVVTFMLKNPDDYSECCGKKIGDQSLIKAINQRGGGNPLESQEYKTELAQFQSDKADKSDNSGHLPLVNLSKRK